MDTTNQYGTLSSTRNAKVMWIEQSNASGAQKKQKTEKIRKNVKNEFFDLAKR